MSTRPRVVPSKPLSSEEIYDEVKRMAARFEFRPNERINEIELSKRLNVSRTPLREVLNRLMVEGLLTRTQNKGFLARPLDAARIFDLYEYRKGIECVIAVLACERATEEEIAQLDAFCRESSGVSEGEDPLRLCQLDEEFHLRLARMARNPEFERALDNVNTRIHYVRWIRMQHGSRSVTENEHAAIVEALRRRDAEGMAHLLDTHIARRMDQIVAAVKAGFAEIYTREGRASDTPPPALSRS